MPEPDKAVVTYVDQAGKRATSTHYVTSGLTLAQITEGLSAFLELIDNVVGTIIYAAQALLSIDISTFTNNTTGVTSDVEQVGEFVGVTAANRKVLINVPGIKDNLSVAGSDDLDTTQADIAAFISALEDGIVTAGGTIIPCDVGELDIVEVTTARERVRNSGSRA